MMPETSPITLPMVRIVKRCRGLTLAQKWLWMDLYPYFRQGCWQTASEQGMAIDLSEESVDRYRRLLLEVGLARQGVRARLGRRGQPGPTWFAAFPEHLGGLGRKISDEDVVRLAEELDRHIRDRLSDPDARIGIRANRRKPGTTRAYHDTANSETTTGGASRGEGGRGVGMSFPSQGESPCSSKAPEEGQSPSETEEGQGAREPMDSLEPVAPIPEQEFNRTRHLPEAAESDPPSDFDAYLVGWVGRNAAGGAR